MSDLTPAMDIAQLLNDLGLGTYVDNGTILVGEMPDKPDRVIVLRDTVSLPNEEALGSTVVFTYPGVQVAVRDATLDATSALALQCWRALCNFQGGTLNGTRYHYAKPVQMPMQMPSDGVGHAGRRIYIFNLDCCADMR